MPSSTSLPGPFAIILVSIGCALAACKPAGESDTHWRQKLLGVWEETRNLGCESHHQVTTLSADGSFEVRDSITGCTNRMFVWRGTWSVAYGKFRYTATFSESPDDVPIDAPLEDEIISISDVEWVMLEESTGNRSVARRVEKH